MRVWDELTPEELDGWYALYRVEPFGEDRQEMRLRHLFTQLIAAVSGSEEFGSIYDSLDYLSLLKTPEPVKKQEQDEFAETRAVIGKAFGGM